MRLTFHQDVKAIGDWYNVRRTLLDHSYICQGSWGGRVDVEWSDAYQHHGRSNPRRYRGLSVNCIMCQWVEARNIPAVQAPTSITFLPWWFSTRLYSIECNFWPLKVSILGNMVMEEFVLPKPGQKITCVWGSCKMEEIIEDVQMSNSKVLA